MLIVLTLPELDAAAKPTDMDYFDQWKQLCNKIRGILKTNQEVTMLGQNVFLIPAKTDLPVAVEILGLAKTYQIRYRVLYLDQPPDWVDSPKFR
jgi:hypothetical protein